MSLHLVSGDRDHRRARIEGEIRQRALSLRKIGEDRVHLEERLAANQTLQKMISRRYVQSRLMVGRSEARNHKFG
jgi:hypothetical protein